MNENEDLALSEFDAVSDCVEAYESQFASGVRFPDILKIVESTPQVYREAALVEVILTDMERRKRLGNHKSSAAYLREYKEIAGSRELHDRIVEGESRIQEVSSVESAPALQSTVAAQQTPTSTSTGIPVSIGKYRVLKKLGRGGGGTVYLCHDDGLSRKVAVKLPPASETDTRLSNLLSNDGRTLSKIEHPNVVRVFELGECEHGPYLVMEYVEGVNLFERMNSSEGYSVQQAIEWVASIADALDTIHQQNVVHRDIKPGNILIDRNDKAILCDFGLAANDRDFVIDDRALLGTLPYMSPEQLSGGCNAGIRSDIYSLGVVLYQLLTEHLPFTSQRPARLKELIENADPDPPRARAPEVPQSLSQTCLKAISKSPEDRFQSAGDFAKAVRRAIPGKTRLWVASALFILLAGIALTPLVAKKLQVPVVLEQVHVFRSSGKDLGGTKLTVQSIAEAPLASSDRLCLSVRTTPTSDAFMFACFFIAGQEPIFHLSETRTDDFSYPNIDNPNEYVELPGVREGGVVIAVAGVLGDPLKTQELNSLLNWDVSGTQIPDYSTLGRNHIDHYGFENPDRSELGSAPAEIPRNLIKAAEAVFSYPNYRVMMFTYENVEAISDRDTDAP